MKKSILIAGVMLVVGASIASAQGGINLSWNDCGGAGADVMTFACNTNSGAPFGLYASFDPPAGIDNFLGVSSQIDFTFDAATTPDWWAHGAALCRGGTALATNFGFLTGPFSCSDFYAGAAAGGYAYDVGFGAPNRCRMRIQCAVPFDNRGPVDPGTEYYAYSVLILRSKTTGTNPCTGCQTAACIVLNEIQLFQPPDAANDPVLSMPLNRAYVSWQSTPQGCPGSTPTKNTTWGQVKSLYR